ncbi:unnamed protein product [Medioppia subpectinata]|uniref:Hook C-terminal domain-containing protein n=1 Tax=Medioppia subpectinata TaxID=1979941 RepID=A0A7R9KTP5_9ACAR|nr:unnamed protein product [Medioppia subpectinata]CAG2109281.1 unnamed protein product [Medioppia subpectinata]
MGGGADEQAKSLIMNYVVIILLLVIQLEAELRDSSVRQSDDDQMQTFQDIIKEKALSLETTKHELLNAQQEIESLKGVIVKKDEELTEREDQYKKYVNKAKAVTNALDQLSQHSIASTPSISSTSSDANNDINYWKQLVQQKESEISKYKHDFEESNGFREMEAKLLTISFHNLSSHLQRKSAEERIRNGSLNSSQNNVSFLARQRQATTRKYNMPTVSQR